MSALWLAAILLALPDAPSGADAPRPFNVDGAVAGRLEALEDPEWTVRAAATRWLIEHHRRWAMRLPVTWEPAHPEARWRWRRIRETVGRLQELPRLLDSEPREALRWTVARLHEEAGAALVDALAASLAADAARVRQAAIELLVGLPGVDLRARLAPVADDPSPWVRRALYRVALLRDREWAAELIERALARQERPTLRIETVRAIARLGGGRWEARLREEWPTAGPELRAEIARARVALGTAELPTLHWMLRSERYPLVMTALEELGRRPSAADIPVLLELVDAPEPELRRRALALLEGVTGPEDALELVALLAREDSEVVRFAATRLVALEAEDFYGDVDAALRRLPAAERFLCIESRAGRAVAVPVHAPAAADEAQARPALLPGRREATGDER